MIYTTKRRIKNYLIWECLSDSPITDDIAHDEMISMGYHPAGYGFYGFESDGPYEYHTEKYYFSSWTSSNSCD